MALRPIRSIVEDVLTKNRTKALWTSIYEPALPITPQDFEIAALMPMMLYLARFGHRRGRGRFVATFGTQTGNGPRVPSVADVAAALAADDETGIEGFDDAIGQAVLGDLLLSRCLENRNHAEGRQEQVQRIFPIHYFASWIDLPESAAHLRNVPELLTAVLARQETGVTLLPGTDAAFRVGVDDFSQNPLLAVFGRSCGIGGQHAANLAADTFLEADAVDIGIDELLTVRMGQLCDSAPNRAATDHAIPNWMPLARRASDGLHDDLTTFISVYGSRMPRQVFLQMLEAGIGLGLVNLLLSTATIANHWEKTGEVPEPRQQSAIPLFVDASQGQDQQLRQLSEDSMWDCLHRYARFPIAMMLLRVLDNAASSDENLMAALPPDRPDPTARIRFLGDVLKGQGHEMLFLRWQLQTYCQQLANALQQADVENDAVVILRSTNRNPAERLAEALCMLMGDKQQGVKFRIALDSALMVDRPNGLAVRRQVTRTIDGKKKKLTARSIVLSSAALDFLVHRHVRAASADHSAVPLSLQRFLDLLRDRYGLYVDRAPPGQAIASERLSANKAWMERRLRDLGLWIGVNDAESMKQLRPRHCVEGEDHV